MYQKMAADICVNVLSVNEETSDHFSFLKKQIEELYEISESTKQSITFLSPWVPPFRLINGLSQAFPLLEITVQSVVENQLACKSFHKNGLVDIKEVPFYQKDTLEEFKWPRT